MYFIVILMKYFLIFNTKLKNLCYDIFIRNFMNIGLDIDNVITAFDNGILKEFLLEDKNKRNAGIINDNARHINHGMFDWSQDEIDEFYNSNMERISKDLKPRRNCKKYMDKLLQDGHKLYLISHRAYPHYLNAEKTTLDWVVFSFSAGRSQLRCSAESSAGRARTW